LLVAFLYGSSVGPAGERIATGAFFSITIPGEWTCHTNGSVLVFGLGKKPPYLDGIAMLRIKSDTCRWWTCDKAFERAFSEVLANLPELDRSGWMLEPTTVDNGFAAPMRRTHESSCGYLAVTATNGSGRLFVSGDTVVLVLVWSKKQRASSTASRILESFELQAVTSDGIDRSMLSASRDLSHDQALLLVKEGQGWLDRRAVAPGNTWRAYRCLLDAYHWYAEHAVEGLADYDAEMATEWRLLAEAAAHLDELFRSKRTEIVAALQEGNQARGKKLVRELQDEIPDRSDYRWRWGQDQLNKHLKSKADKKGFLM
jgi:hypothetical protein